MRRASILSVLSLFVGALVSCSGVDGSSPTSVGTSEESATTGEAAWSTVVIDAEGLTGVTPRALTDADGGFFIVYQREVEPEAFETMLAHCGDPDCADPSVVKLSGPDRTHMSGATLNGAGAPMVSLLRLGDDGASSMLLVACSDARCTSVVETVIGDAVPIGLAAREDGTTYVAYGSQEEDASTNGIFLGICDDPMCRSHRPVEIGTLAGFGHGADSLQFLTDGSPIIHVEAWVPPESSEPFVAVCGDPRCGSVSRVDVPAPAPVTGEQRPGLPRWAYVGNAESVRLLACADERCTSIRHEEVYRRFDGSTILSAALLDGVAGPMIVLETISSDAMASAWSGDGIASHTLLWITCTDPTCTETSSISLGEGSTPSVVTVDGSTVIATQTGRPNLCVIEGCVESPDAASTLTLYVCDGTVCVVGDPGHVDEATEVAVASRYPSTPVVFESIGDIMVLEPGSLAPRRVTEGPEWDGGPAWSPDGSRIAFHSDRGSNEDDLGENFDIYVIDTDGGNLTRVSDDAAGEFNPDWSPDGTQLVFSRQSGGDGRYLVVVDLATGDERQLTDPAADADTPAWSPDGSVIAFNGRVSGDCSWDGSDCNIAIFTVAPDGSGVTQLTDAPGIDAFPEWSPDGSRIAFHASRTDPDRFNWDIYTMTAQGENVSALTDYPGADQFPVWSPDGTLVLFQSDRSGAYHLYTIRAIDGTGVTLIAPDVTDAAFPDWYHPSS